MIKETNLWAGTPCGIRRRIFPAFRSERNHLAFALTGVALLATVYVAPAWSQGPTPTSAENISIHFSHDLPVTLAEARKSGKPLVLVCFAVWCPNCRSFEANTLPAPQVQAMGDDFHWVRQDS